MSSKEIKNHYGTFAEAARQGPIVHTSHGRPTLVTISIDHARAIPQLRDAIGEMPNSDTAARLARLLALGGTGASLAGQPAASRLAQRSQEFRGND